MRHALTTALSVACVRVAVKRCRRGIAGCSRVVLVPKGTLTMTLNGRRELSLQALVRIARGLEMLPSDLLREAEAYVEGAESRGAAVADRKGRKAA
jgi:hypothetical protein